MPEDERTCLNFEGNSRKPLGVLQAKSAVAGVFDLGCTDDDGAGLKYIQAAPRSRSRPRIFVLQYALSLSLSSALAH